MGVEQKAIGQRSTSRAVSALGLDVQPRLKEVDAFANPHRSPMGAEQGARTRVFVEQAPHRESDRLRLVAARQLPGGFFDQRHDLRTIDGDHVGHWHFYHYVCTDIMIRRHGASKPIQIGRSRPFTPASPPPASLRPRRPRIRCAASDRVQWSTRYARRVSLSAPRRTRDQQGRRSPAASALASTPSSSCSTKPSQGLAC